jgi:hypothetical protein
MPPKISLQLKISCNCLLIIENNIDVTIDTSSINSTEVWSERLYLNVRRRLEILLCDRCVSEKFTAGAVMGTPNNDRIVCPPSRTFAAEPV